MSKDVYYKLTEELSRPPTDEEVADRTADMIVSMTVEQTPKTCFEHDYQGWGHCTVSPEQESVNIDEPACNNCSERKPRLTA